MESILQTLGAKTPLDEEGNLTREGEVAWEKLILVVTELNSIGAIRETPDRMESYFEEIIRCGY